MGLKQVLPALLVVLGAASAEAAPSRRALLMSERPGSIVLPKPLMQAALPDICRDEAGATDPIYAAKIPAAAFRFGKYAGEALPLRLDHALAALDGAALLSIEDREAAFELTSKEAAAIREGHEAKRIGLEVTFQLDDDSSLPACFSAPRSDQWALHVEALTFTLVDDKGTKLAVTRTPALRRLEAWARPGDATIRIEARPLDDSVDAERTTVALGSVRPAVENCTTPVVASVADPVSLAYVASVNAAGEVKDVRPELYTADLDDAVACVAKALTSAELSKAARGYEVSIVVAIERPGFDVEM